MTRTRTEKLDLLQGTLDMMVLCTLSAGPANGYEIARAIERLSDDVLAVDHGSLYPALHRLERSGLIVAKWETSSTNRRARYYRLTSTGRKRLAVERSRLGANGSCDHPRNAAGLTYRSLHPSRERYSQTGFLLPSPAFTDPAAPGVVNVASSCVRNFR